MGRGGKFESRRYGKRGIRSKDKGSDESDEDYTVGEDEEFNDSEEYCSFSGEESEESLGELEEEDEERVQVRKVGRPKRRRVFPDRKKNRFVKTRKKRRSYKADDDEDSQDEDYEISEDDDDDEDDEEFTPDEVDLDYEEELETTKKIKKVGRPPLLEKCLAKGRKRKRNSKKPGRKKPTKNCVVRRKLVAHRDRAYARKKSVVKQRSRKSSGQRSRLVANSDSDFMSYGSSDFEYTISEEEREQVREASEFCRDLTTNLRSSSSTKILQGVLFQQRKHPERKGKEKVEDLKNEVGKQVCGICLSEEGKKTVRGTLDCCSHYFCFPCIMEWSKVESRCPLCKQRFVTISKPARSNSGVGQSAVVVQVPERDQVYQPSEEELRGYLDPYENVICTECQQGGDDALMLLCDLCDSPSHTYCVGLGHSVPEGNWYCEGCRPTALGPSSPQASIPMPDRRTMSDLSLRSSPVENFREFLDLNTAYVPETPLTQGTGVLSPAGRPVGDFQATSPASGLGVSTLSERRRIQRQIHHLLNNRLSELSGRTNEMSATTPASYMLGSQIRHGGEMALENAIIPERWASHQTFSHIRLQDNLNPSSPSRSSHSRGQLIQGQTSMSADTSVNGILQAGLPGISWHINSRLGYGQPHPCSSRLSTIDDSISPHGEVNHLNVEKEQVQKIVRGHLKSLSSELELGYDTFKNIARKCTHTILAACGLEHESSEVHPVQLPSLCSHFEEMDGRHVSLMKGCCYSCFDAFVRQVVGEITNTNTQLPPLFRVRD